MPLLPVSGLWKLMTDKKLGMRSECNHILNAAEQIDRHVFDTICKVQVREMTWGLAMILLPKHNLQHVAKAAAYKWSRPSHL
ncbi:hypothetical protein CFP56_020572 [Quercus suber]|uniref:Uncharacterized protein n=1 Tax=Quercus suber TaxID=58331 RepID=A0AAW0KHA6_QUESU